MVRKNNPRAVKPKSARKKTKPRIGRPDMSVLARYSPTDGANSHPDWVKTQFPGYIVPHGGHEAVAVREFAHGGHLVKIITTYRVEVDGIQSVHTFRSMKMGVCTPMPRRSSHTLLPSTL